MSAVRADAAPPLVDRDTVTGLDALAQNLDREQLIWSSGYLAGLAAARGAGQAVAHAPQSAAAAAADESPCLILYATETGNCRRVAQAVDEQMRAAGLKTRLVDLRDFDAKSLRRARRATFVVATHGLGDPPEGTEAFFEFWTSERAPRLEELSYSVLALGDSTYEDFCEIGRELDERLEALGARRIHDRVDCDVDFEDDAATWRDAVVEAVAEAARADGGAGQPAGGAPTVTSLHPAFAPAPAQPAHSRERPFMAEILVNQKITGRESSKDVRHVELSLEGSGLTYQPGDAIGIWPENPPALVDTLLELTGLDGDAEVTVGKEASSLRDALTRRLEITKLSRGFAEAYANALDDSELKRVLASADTAREYLAPRQIVDVVAEHRGRVDAQQFAGALRKLTPRLYSVASSLDAYPDEAHLTVGVVEYERFGRAHVGAASSFLAGSARESRTYVEPNDHFRLPADPATPVIMIGAGTGVAPYRAFVQHRALHGAAGESWLIYGDRTMRSDFLYQLEWLRHVKEGVLTRLTVAFSRDQVKKIYVQDRIAESAADLYDWLERGAHVYVCGEAENMAPAVHAALAGVIGRIGGKSEEQAEEYLQQMKAAKRYQRDVY
ncbi:MAG: assimilatory sulfite reductase (NADPH) flavoprotein subunit [Gammaproteobacteria bacterium]|nr:assimilatory sulfite reductase (NADPH) flavoprotein subunit [Gammaproteobacteria bacterium]